jgi:hypothetical protein
MISWWWPMAAFFIGCFVGASALAHVYDFSRSIPKRPSDEPPSFPMADYGSVSYRSIK